MGEVYLRDKAISNDYDYVYSETANGSLVRVPKNEIVTGYDMVISAKICPANTVDVSDYQIVKGEVTSVLEKCANGKKPRVLLIYESEYEEVYSKEYYEAKSVTANHGLVQMLQVEFDILQYSGHTKKLAILIEGSGVTKVWNSNYDAVIEFDVDSHGLYMEAEDIAFSSDDICRVFNKVNEGKEAKLLIKGNCTFDSSSTKYPVEFSVASVIIYGTRMYVNFLAPTNYGIGGTVSIGFAISNYNATIHSVTRRLFQNS